ncbi:MAG: helix-turn-helix domain-containing protein [Nitrospinales bacterium]
MYKFNGQLRDDLFIKIPKKYINEGAWARLSQAGKAIYPVIRKFSNEGGSCFPSQLTIAIMAGVTEKTVRQGLDSLNNFPEFFKEKYITQRGRYAYRYRFEPAPPKNSDSISIRHSFFNGGNWSQLLPSAKAIYFVLKRFSWWDLDLYAEWQDEVAEPNEYTDFYKVREFDFANPDLSIIAEFSGITKRTLVPGLISLSDHNFIENIEPIDGERAFKVFTSPEKTYKSEWLNAKAQKRYEANLENITP